MTYSLDLPELFKMTHNRNIPKVSKYKIRFFIHSINILNLSSKELKAVAKIRGIKGYKSLSEDELLRALTYSRPVKKGEKPKANFSKARMEKIRKEFNESRHKFSKSINEIRKNLYEIESEKNLFESKVKEIERNLTELL